jgi:hypothetical protein
LKVRFVLGAVLATMTAILRKADVSLVAQRRLPVSQEKSFLRFLIESPICTLQMMHFDIRQEQLEEQIVSET